ncbi:MAG TPA: ABC transporter ATP-binding protein [Candidatus Sulfomarinibacteraceae bacterium]|nr:ABC transporter ATP-binding protein [Candidatus Sulfomarinibacteraceae bacterium]
MLEIEIQKQLRDYVLDLSLSAPGGATVLFGRSGSGKSMTLACVAGLARPDEGRIIINGCTFFDSRAGVDLRPQERRVGYVTQDYLLFPHMTVWQNVAFGLVKQSRREQARIVQEALAWLGLEHLAQQRPGELSGGQQQRVALARALVIRPQVLLLDEPFSALDSPTRIRLRQDLQRLQQELDVPLLFVTHDLAEALLLGEQMAVMDSGHLLQLDTPQAIRRSPANALVAELVGRDDLLTAPGESIQLPETL